MHFNETLFFSVLGKLLLSSLKTIFYGGNVYVSAKIFITFKFIQQ